jgi:hypothetical protein
MGRGGFALILTGTDGLDDGRGVKWADEGIEIDTFKVFLIQCERFEEVVAIGRRFYCGSTVTAPQEADSQKYERDE